MSANIAEVRHFGAQCWRDLVLNREVPKIHQRNAIGIRGIKEVVQAQSLRQWIPTVSTDRRIRGQRRAIQQIKCRRIGVGLRHGLGQRNWWIVVRRLAEYASQRSRGEATSISGSYYGV